MTTGTLSRVRLPLAGLAPAEFHALRDRWRDVASGSQMSKAAHRVASLLPSYVHRQHGYAYPTDADLAEKLNATVKTVSRGVAGLEGAGLIERHTRVKRDSKNEAVGKERRIYLTVPGEVNGQGLKVNGQAPSERTLAPGDWTDGVHISLTDSPRSKREAMRGGVASPAGIVPAPFTDDLDFLDAFDLELVAFLGSKIAPADAVPQAFDLATFGNNSFMPLDWASIGRLRPPAARDWFLARGEQLLERGAAQ